MAVAAPHEHVRYDIFCRGGEHRGAGPRMARAHQRDRGFELFVGNLEQTFERAILVLRYERQVLPRDRACELET